MTHFSQQTNKLYENFIIEIVHKIKNEFLLSLRDGTGRHPGFRNQCTCACRFESDRRQIILFSFLLFNLKGKEENEGYISLFCSKAKRKTVKKNICYFFRILNIEKFFFFRK